MCKSVNRGMGIQRTNSTKPREDQGDLRYRVTYVIVMTNIKSINRIDGKETP